MKKTKQGTKKDVIWRATCTECASEFEEKVSNLKTEDDRDGMFARSKCPDCKTDMFFYPPPSNNGDSWGWGRN
jgi:hypothetical protein